MSGNGDGDSGLDSVFAEVGEFGVYQIVTFLLICIPNTLAATYLVNYIFTTNSLDYRCKVPQCDVGEDNRAISYEAPWLNNAIPYAKNGFENCVRFAPINSNASEFKCGADQFNTSSIIECSEFIYKTDETNVQTEFNIHCSNSYKLALIGSINSLGRFLLLPITGMLSDKFGRLRVVVIGLFCCSIFGLIKSFSVNYEMYLLSEFLEASAGTCTFSGIYVLGIEWISSKYRALGTSFIVVSFPIGEVILGVIAMYIHNFRHMLRVLYVPGLFVWLYFWLVPESIRWLLVTGRIERAIKVLKRMAAVNGKSLSEKSIEMLRLRYSSDTISKGDQKELPIIQQLRSVVRCRKLGFRLLICCYLWITCCFCFYGMSLISTYIRGENRYVSYIMVQAVEIPGALLPMLLLNRFGRKKLLFISLCLVGISTMVAPWIPQDKSTFVLLLFMVGKSSITFAFNVLYIYTAELWPTNLRSTIINSCSMTGRTGAMLAPLTILLIVKTPFLPFFLFGSTALLAAAFVLLCPETFSKKLPDSIDDAKSL